MQLRPNGSLKKKQSKQRRIICQCVSGFSYKVELTKPSAGVLLFAYLFI